MTLAECIKLLDAGYTREEIDHFDDLYPDPDPVSDPDPNPDPVSDPDPNPDPVSDPDPNPNPVVGNDTSGQLAALTAMVQSLTAAVQANNIRASGYGGQKLSAEEALAQGVYGNK